MDKRHRRKASASTASREMTMMRIMGELVFLHGRDEAEVIGAKLRAAGFEFKITDDVDDCSEATVFMMVWRDVGDVEAANADRALDEFRDAVNAVTVPFNQHHKVDCWGFVPPDHVPARFGDHGFGDDFGFGDSMH
jgi:hypothetical protein